MAERFSPIEEIEIKVPFSKLLQLYTDHPIPQHQKASKKLASEFIQYDKYNFREFKREVYTLTHQNKNYNYVRLSVIYKNNLIQTEACREKKKEAKGYASELMISEILSSDKYFYMKHDQANALKNFDEISLMPPYVIGLPNYRGHCFFVPLFVPLFNIYDFVETLVKANDIAIGYLDAHRRKRPGSKSSRNQSNPDLEQYQEEPEFLWTRAIMDFFSVYRKASRQGELKVENVPNNIHVKYPKLYGDYFNKAKSGAYQKTRNQDDLRLDRRLIKICLELADFQSPSYAEPGGFVCKLFKDILRKLSAESLVIPSESPFNELFNTEIRFEYFCENCALSIPKFKKRKSFSMFRIPAEHETYGSIQEIIDDHKYFLSLQNEKCEHIKKGIVCNNKMKDLQNIVITKLPKILAFETVPYEKKGIPITMSEEITIKSGENISTYELRSYSVVFEVFKDAKGDLISLRHILPDDRVKESGGLHIMANIKTNLGWFEVNNDKVYEPLRDYPFVKPENLIFYVKKNDLSHIPRVGNFYDVEGDLIITADDDVVMFADDNCDW
uniref:USP domain-containing protein n=1 Tax=Tetranychus urticae TaxID=32264 RepID=T1KEI6_TETUR